jgi:hypothetical protein
MRAQPPVSADHPVQPLVEVGGAPMLEPADLPVLRERRPPVRLGVLGVFPKLLIVAGHRDLSGCQ